MLLADQILPRYDHLENYCTCRVSPTPSFLELLVIDHKSPHYSNYSDTERKGNLRRAQPIFWYVDGICQAHEHRVHYVRAER